MSLDNIFAGDLNKDYDLDKIRWTRPEMSSGCIDSSRGLSMISSELPKESELTNESVQASMVEEAQSYISEVQVITSLLYCAPATRRDELAS